MEDERWDRYRERSWYREPYPDSPPTWAGRFERLLTQAVVLGLAALVLVQALLTQPQLRRMLVMLERLEGGPVAGATGGQGSDEAGGPSGSGGSDSGGVQPWPAAVSQPATAPVPTAHLTVSLINRSSAPDARLLVGGRVVAQFRNGKASARVAMGQAVTVDGSAVPDELVFRVVAAGGFLFDSLGRQVSTRASRAVLVPAGGP